MSLLTCVVPWPACPNCFVGLVGPAGLAWTCADCGRAWQGPPLGAPCGREPTHVATDETGSVLVCEPHAALAHRFLPGAKITKLSIARTEIVL